MPFSLYILCVISYLYNLEITNSVNVIQLNINFVANIVFPIRTKAEDWKAFFHSRKKFPNFEMVYLVAKFMIFPKETIPFLSVMVNGGAVVTEMFFTANNIYF